MSARPSEILNLLMAEFSPDILISDKAHLTSFSADRSVVEPQLPIASLIPQEIGDIKRLLDLANVHGFSITTRGSGTSTTGASVPAKESVVISLHHLNRILEWDDQNHVLTVEPGVLTGDIHRFLDSKGFFYPPDPASSEISTIGGNVATNAGGPRTVKYGVTGDYILGLDGWFGDGQPFSLGGKLFKNVAGYDIMRLLIGSEGTLGIVSRILLRVIPKPESRRMMLACFDTFHDAMDFFNAIRQEGISLSMLEFFDNLCLNAAKELVDIDVPNKKAYLMLELDGDSNVVTNEIERVYEILNNMNGTECYFPHSEEEDRRMILLRSAISPSLRTFGRDKCSHDVGVPPASIPAFLHDLYAMSDQYPVSFVGYGHFGDGNIHVNVLRMDLPSREWDALLPDIESALMTLVMEYKGTITAEHGVGLTKKRFLKSMYSPEICNRFNQIKQLFDPNTVLNVGKIFD